jgi:hypothetical protein
MTACITVFCECPLWYCTDLGYLSQYWAKVWTTGESELEISLFSTAYKPLLVTQPPVQLVFTAGA